MPAAFHLARVGSPLLGTASAVLVFAGLDTNSSAWQRRKVAGKISDKDFDVLLLLIAAFHSSGDVTVKEGVLLA